jgi:hypothetical protein
VTVVFSCSFFTLGTDILGTFLLSTWRSNSTCNNQVKNFSSISCTRWCNLCLRRTTKNARFCDEAAQDSATATFQQSMVVHSPLLVTISYFKKNSCSNFNSLTFHDISKHTLISTDIISFKTVFHYCSVSLYCTDDWYYDLVSSMATCHIAYKR